MAVKRVILIRPGETDWNRQGRYQGWVAVPLNAHGRQQAEALANFVRNIGLSALYASDLKRAAETAEVIAQRLGFGPIYDARLRERAIGAWQGLVLDEIRLWYPQDYEKFLNDVEGFVVPQGESRSQVKARVIEAFRDFIVQDKGETIGIISHTTAIRGLLSELVFDNQTTNVEFGNTSVTTIACGEKGRWTLVASNDVMHLEGLEAQSVKEPED